MTMGEPLGALGQVQHLSHLQHDATLFETAWSVLGRIWGHVEEVSERQASVLVASALRRGGAASDEPPMAPAEHIRTWVICQICLPSALWGTRRKVLIVVCCVVPGDIWSSLPVRKDDWADFPAEVRTAAHHRSVSAPFDRMCRLACVCLVFRYWSCAYHALLWPVVCPYCSS